MFWIFALVLTLAWFFVKLGATTATLSFIALAFKVSLVLLAVSVFTATVLWLRRK